MIFEEQVSRRPNQYPWTTEFVEAMHNGFWTDKEFNFNSDKHDFLVTLSAQEREVIVRTLSAISQIEVAVKTFWGKLGDNLPHPYIADMGYVMANVEVIHNNAYERLLHILGLDDVFEANLKLPCIGNRVKYLKKYCKGVYKDDKKQFVYALILFTLFVENVSLFSQFYVINWFARNKNVLKDTDQQVKYTRNEENLHALVGIKLVNVIREEYPELFDAELEERIKQEARVAFESEAVIIDWIMAEYKQDGLTPEVLKEFVKKRLNESLVQIGYSEIFVTNPALIKETKWFYEELLGNNMADFFKTRPTEYSKKSQSFNVDDMFADI